MKRLKGHIIYSNIGHGFKAPSEAISKVFAKRGMEIKVYDFCKELELKAFAWVAENGWKFFLRTPVIYDFIYKITSKSNTKYLESKITKRYKNKILNHLKQENPDFIFSVTPHLTKIITMLIKEEKLPIALFGYNTDVLLSHNLYISNDVDKYFVPSKEGYELMIKGGLSKDILELTSLIIDDKYMKKFASINEERKILGLKDKFTILLTFGGEGIGYRVEKLIIKAISSKLDVQIVVVCGRNEKLRKNLTDIKKRFNYEDLIVLGFINNLEDYLYCCDINGGKSGLNSVFESIYLKKPFLVLKAMTNEQFAANMIIKNNIGWWPKNNKESIEILRRIMIDKNYLKGYIENIKKLDYKFGAEDIVEKVELYTKRKIFQNRKKLFFDLAGTLCDIQINKNNWNAINYNSINGVLKKIDIGEEDGNIDSLCKEFVAKKSILRKNAKVTLKEYEIKKQIQDYIGEINKKYNLKINPTKKQLLELEEIFIEAELNATNPIQGSTKILELLSDKYDLYLISNNVSRLLVEKILQRFGMEKYFKKIFVSCDIGIRKPDKKFVDYILKETASEPKECIIIGDRLTQDILMAEGSDIKTIYVNAVGHEDNENINNVNFDHSIKNINELKEILV